MKKKFICIVLSVVLVISFFTVSAEEKATDKVLSDLVEDNSGFETVIENKKYALLYNSQTDEIAVSTDSYIWYSNPKDRDNDNLADAQEKYNLQSQAILYYYNGEVLVGMDSYSNSTKLGNTKHEIKDNKLFVTYRLGEEKFSVNKLPQVISRHRMEKEILPKLTDSEKETLLKRYSLYSKDELDAESYKTVKLNFPAIADHDIYVRSQLPDYLGEEIWSILEDIGYTVEDLQKDCDENGVENTYTPSITFELVLVYSLTEDGFSVECDPQTIKYSEDYKPVRLELLPFFGAAGINENGYMLVPDGSGAVIEFNNGKTKSDEYWRTLFGDDTAIPKNETEAKRRELTLPIFALSNEKGGFLAEIEYGYECAGISADISGKANNYNNIYSFFTLFSSDTVNISTNKSDSNMFISVSDNIFSGNLSVKYHFTKGYTHYDKFACIYRDILLKNGSLRKNTSREIGSFNLELIGTAIVKKKFLGLPYTTLTALTNYKDAALIVSKLDNDNINITFANALNGGKLQKSAAKIKPAHVLGNSSDFKNLQSICPNISFSYYALRQSNAQRNAIAHSVSDEEVKIYQYDPVSRLSQKTGVMLQLSPKVLKNYSSSVIKTCNKNGIQSLSVKDIAQYLNSDLGRNRQIDRYEARVNIEKYLEKLSDSLSLSADNAGVYSLKYLSEVKNIPISSSDYSIFDNTVPFYGIVLRGILPIVTEPVNTTDDSRTQFLKTVELGAELQYSWIYSIADNVQDSTENYYNRKYSDTIEQAKVYYDKIKPLYTATKNSVITDHKYISEKLVYVKYDNSTAVYVNYDDTEVTVDGISIEPYDFKVVN